ncbi:MAG: hypothetical protein K9N06_10330 [Candidatus Cloacimonetes bacterium]|nr:hypothetical protein [Candidatus Cloacimonadota bacterium]
MKVDWSLWRSTLAEVYAHPQGFREKYSFDIDKKCGKRISLENITEGIYEVSI